MILDRLFTLRDIGLIYKIIIAIGIITLIVILIYEWFRESQKNINWREKR